MVQDKAQHMSIMEDENGHAVRWWLPTHLLHWLSFSVLHLIESSSVPLGDSPLRDYTVTIFRTITLPVSESFSFHDNSLRAWFQQLSHLPGAILSSLPWGGLIEQEPCMALEAGVGNGGYPNPSQEILWTLEKQRKWFIDLPFFITARLSRTMQHLRSGWTGTVCVALTRQLCRSPRHSRQ